MRIFLAGATGVIGQPLLRTLAANGHDVVAMTRSKSKFDAIEDLGGRAVECNVFDRDRLLDVVTRARPDVVVHQLTAIPDRINTRKVNRDLALTNRLRTEGTRLLIEAAQTADADQFVAQSIAFAYRPCKEPTPQGVAEESPLHTHAPRSFREMVGAVAELEERALASEDIASAVLRYGFFYGPGTIYAGDGSFAEDLRNRRIPLVGKGRGRFSFVHGEDAAAATVATIEARATGTFNITDDRPVRAADWLPRYAQLLSAPKPWRVPGFLAYLGGGPYSVYLMEKQPGADNTRARTELDWSPRFPDWRSGFEAMLAGGAE